MKNPFNRPGLVPVAKDENPVHPKGYSEVITKVHMEFDTAGEKLYQEALKIINATKLLNDEKVKRLKKLGFVATKEVKDAEDVLGKRQYHEKLVERIAYYRKQYPLHKFITEEQVKEICMKYGLVWGKVRQYTGFVPESKLKIMEEFALKDKDARHYVRNWAAADSEVSYEEFLKHKDNESERYYADRLFEIAAPAKDFNISSRQMVQDHKIVDKPVPDPVVLAPVVGGYLVVCAWGEEANDPIVQNEINN